MMEWAVPYRPLIGEAPEAFAERLMSLRKPRGYPRHIGTEFYLLQKWAVEHAGDVASAPAPAGSIGRDDRAIQGTVGEGKPLRMVHALWHYRVGAGQAPVPEDEDDDPKSIGLYSSREKAEEAIARLRGDKGFRDWPGGFRISSYPLDDTGWIGGYRPDPDPDTTTD